MANPMPVEGTVSQSFYFSRIRSSLFLYRKICKDSRLLSFLDHGVIPVLNSIPKRFICYSPVQSDEVLLWWRNVERPRLFSTGAIRQIPYSQA